MSTVPPINRANAARALLEHGNKAPWWFDLWGRAVEYTAGGAAQNAVQVTGDTVSLRPGAAIYRRDLTAEAGPVAVNIRAGGLTMGRVLTFELHLETGAAVPSIAWDTAIQWEDFGWPHLETFRTHVFYFRSSDGGKTWVGGLGYTYGPRRLYRGGAVQNAAAVTGGVIRLAGGTALYILDATQGGEIDVSISSDTALYSKTPNVQTFELAVKAGAVAPVINWPAAVKWEDFGGLWRIEPNRTYVLQFRSADGGETWTAGVMYTIGLPKVYRGGLIQKAADVAGNTVTLDAETAIYRINLANRKGAQTLALDASRLDAVTRCNTIVAELHIKAGASDLEIPAAQNVTFADFGGLWRVEKNRVTVAEARSYDGGATWTICKLYTYKY